MSTDQGPVAALGGGDCLAPGYRVVDHLRRGSLLDVYEVWSSRRQCACVAKVLRPESTRTRTHRQRLVREGRLLMRLSHPHIVRAYEVISGPSPALILETLSGATLAHLIALNPRGLRLADVAVLGLHLCSAVQYLHTEGVLHLDLKPSNIVCARGEAKVLDLDIAQPPGPGLGQGTRQYMAPEQVRCQILGPATDVWGIGMVLFEAATGHRPFDSQPASTQPQIELHADSISTYHTRWPRSLSKVIDAALRLDPAARPVPVELAATLKALL